MPPVAIPRTLTFSRDSLVAAGACAPALADYDTAVADGTTDIPARCLTDRPSYYIWAYQKGFTGFTAPATLTIGGKSIVLGVDGDTTPVTVDIAPPLVVDVSVRTFNPMIDGVKNSAHAPLASSRPLDLVES